MREFGFGVGGVEEGGFVRGRWNSSSVVFLFSFKVVIGCVRRSGFGDRN